MAEVWLGVAEVAERLGSHPKTVLRALRKKELRGYQRGPNATWRIAQSDVDAWVRGEKPSKAGEVTVTDTQPTLEDVHKWGVTCDVPDAGAALGIGRNKAYDLAKKGQFPVKVLKVGSSYRVVTSELVRFLSGEVVAAPIEAPPATAPKAKGRAAPSVPVGDELIAAVSRMPLSDLERLRDIVATAIAVRTSEGEA